MWSPMYTLSFVASVLFQTKETREERGAAFTEYVVLVAAVVAVIVAIGFTDLDTALKAKITSIAAKVNPA